VFGYSIHVAGTEPSTSGSTDKDEARRVPLDAAFAAEGIQRSSGGQHDGGDRGRSGPIVIEVEKKYEAWNLQHTSANAEKARQIPGRYTEEG